jgi:hypothetical protein
LVCVGARTAARVNQSANAFVFRAIARKPSLNESIPELTDREEVEELFKRQTGGIHPFSFSKCKG